MPAISHLIQLLSMQQDHSAAQNLTSHFQFQMFWNNIREHILVRNHSPAQHVTRHLHNQMVCYIMKELTMERDYSAAQNVTSHLQCQMFWNNIREHILVRNHSPAQHTTRHLHHQIVCYIMKELIVERNHSAAQNVTSHLQCQMFWGNMRERNLLNMRQYIYIIKWFDISWKNSIQLNGSFHDFQITFICKWLITFGTGKWSLSCSFKVPLQQNVLPHFQQENGFFTVWILSWFSNHYYL